jgi:hypothetical protein
MLLRLEIMCTDGKPLGMPAELQADSEDDGVLVVMRRAVYVAVAFAKAPVVVHCSRVHDGRRGDAVELGPYTEPPRPEHVFESLDRLLGTLVPSTELERAQMWDRHLYGTNPLPVRKLVLLVPAKWGLPS